MASVDVPSLVSISVLDCTAELNWGKRAPNHSIIKSSIPVPLLPPPPPLSLSLSLCTSVQWGFFFWFLLALGVLGVAVRSTENFDFQHFVFKHFWFRLVNQNRWSPFVFCWRSSPSYSNWQRRSTIFVPHFAQQYLMSTKTDNVSDLQAHRMRETRIQCVNVSMNCFSWFLCLGLLKYFQDFLDVLLNLSLLPVVSCLSMLNACRYLAIFRRLPALRWSLYSLPLMSKELCVIPIMRSLSLISTSIMMKKSTRQYKITKYYVP